MSVRSKSIAPEIVGIEVDPTITQGLANYRRNETAAGLWLGRAAAARAADDQARGLLGVAA